MEGLFAPPHAAPPPPPQQQQPQPIAVDYLPELREAQLRVKDLEAKLESSARQASQEAVRHLSQAELFRVTAERLEEQNRGLTEDLRTCRQQLQQSNERNHDLEQQLRHLDDACAALQQKFQRGTARIMELVAQVKSAEDRLEVQRQINVGLQDQLGALAEEAAAARLQLLDTSTTMPSSHVIQQKQPRAGMIAETFRGASRQYGGGGGNPHDTNLTSSAADGGAATTEQQQDLLLRKPEPVSSIATAVAARISSMQDDARHFYEQLPGGRDNADAVAPVLVPSTKLPLNGNLSEGGVANQARGGSKNYQPQQKKKADLSYLVVEQLDADLAAKCKHRDEVEAKFRKLENAKIRTVAEKARKDSLEHELSVLNHDISDIRSQLRGMDQLFR
jgi:predicted  nucleic acid-binding Zn-ribbon protein